MLCSGLGLVLSLYYRCLQKNFRSRYIISLLKSSFEWKKRIWEETRQLWNQAAFFAVKIAANDVTRKAPLDLQSSFKNDLFSEEKLCILGLHFPNCLNASVIVAILLPPLFIFLLISVKFYPLNSSLSSFLRLTFFSL